MPERLSETAANIVENTACRLAPQHGGIITPNHIAPYLPLSLELIKDCLDDMVDGAAVFRRADAEIATYEFTAYRGADAPHKAAATREGEGNCVGCAQPTNRGREILCRSCENALNAELQPLAERTAWPADAVYEHELLHAAAKLNKPQLRAEQLAANTRYTLRQVREKLRKMTLANFVRTHVEESSGALLYEFPAISYRDDDFRRRMGAIRAYPASVMEEVQLRVTRILLALAAMLVAMLIPAFWGIPFPLLIITFVISAPVVTVWMWRRGRREVDVK